MRTFLKYRFFSIYKIRKTFGEFVIYLSLANHKELIFIIMCKNTELEKEEKKRIYKSYLKSDLPLSKNNYNIWYRLFHAAGGGVLHRSLSHSIDL